MSKMRSAARSSHSDGRRFRQVRARPDNIADFPTMRHGCSFLTAQALYHPDFGRPMQPGRHSHQKSATSLQERSIPAETCVK